MLKRKSKSDGKFQSRKRRKYSYKRSPYGYGPIGSGGVAGTKQVISSGPVARPDRAFVMFKTAVLGTATSTAGAFTLLGALKMNSLKNPLGGLSAAQPGDFTLWCGANGAALYGSYIVHAWRLDAEFIGLSGQQQIVAGAPRTAAASAPGSMSQVLEAPRAKFVMAATTGSSAKSKIKAYHTIASIAGQSPQTVAIADSFAALYNATPASECDYDIFIQGSDAATTGAISFVIRVTQYAELFAANRPT